MANLSTIEVNSIREIASCHQTMSSKLQAYADQCNDNQIKQMFSKAAQEAQRSAQNLIQML